MIFDVVLEDLYSSLAAIELSSPQLDAYLNMVEFFASRPVLCKASLQLHMNMWHGNVDSGSHV